MTDNIEQDDFDALLDDFISKQLDEAEDDLNESQELLDDEKPIPPFSAEETEIIKILYPEEQKLYTSYHNFIFAVKDIANDAKMEEPEFVFSPNLLYPRFRPNKIADLNKDIFEAWKLMTLAQPVRLSSLPQNPSDEQILNFSEKTTDPNLQNALISYVETLLELDSCEIAYNLRKAKAKKHRIEKEIYETQQMQTNLKQKYIKAIEKQNFPIDAERLVTNFFKTVRKDPVGAKKLFESNPAIFAPIQTEKLKPRFFGLIKPKKADAIKMNQKIAKFLKNLKP